MASKKTHQAVDDTTPIDAALQMANPISITSPDTVTSESSLEAGFSRLTTMESSIDDDDTSSPTENMNTNAVLSKETVEIRKLDVALEEELKGEAVPKNNDATTIKTNTPNPYRNWECGFGFIGQHDAPDEIPNNKAEFLEAVKGEITTIGFIQNGLTSYMNAIHSGEHHAFTEDFLKSQTDATHKTIGQLFQISNNLQAVVKEVEAVEGDSNEVKTELKEAFGHAQPWIKRTRAILISAHVFYKINYVLGSGNAKHY